MSDAYRTRVYDDRDWAVQRWDWFNGGKEVTPLSFCQFWRTVLLWVTLARIPIIGKHLFLVHLVTYEDYFQRLERQEQRRQRVWKLLKPTLSVVGRTLWLLLQPLRKLAELGWRMAVNVVAFIDERERIKRWSERIILVAAISSIGSVIGIGLTWFIFIAVWNWETVLLVLGSIVFVIVIFAPISYFLGPPIWKAIRSIFSLFWEIAVVSKHRICPPMEIRRG